MSLFLILLVDITSIKFDALNYLRLIEKFKELNNAAIENTSRFVGNPFNALFLLKHMTVDLNKTISIIKNERIRIGKFDHMNLKLNLQNRI